MSEQNISDQNKRLELHNLLGALLINVSSQYFKDQDIFVDGYRFMNCYLENCRLITNRGTFEFHHCLLTPNSKRLYGEEAQKCLQLYSLDNPTPALHEKLKPTIHADGTFSIVKGVTM
jgi:hypothetical protein